MFASKWHHTPEHGDEQRSRTPGLMERFLNTGETIDLETHTLTRCNCTLADPDCILVSLLEIEGPYKPLYFHVNDESHMQVAAKASAELAVVPKAVC